MVWELHEQGKTILLSSHNLAELSELCTDIGIIDAGKMVLSGSMDEIMERIYTSKQIIISVHDQMEKALAFLKESPMVRTISICEKDIMVGFTGDEHRESELLKQMIEAVNVQSEESGTTGTRFHAGAGKPGVNLYADHRSQ